MGSVWQDDRPGAAKVAVLSYGLRQRRFGGEWGSAASLGLTRALATLPMA
ncbi:MAG: hypothetical protein HY236_07490 [Acidobacteria bacterium]|nr:hypothetical protein [Acidobacteriota bacterium]